MLQVRGQFFYDIIGVGVNLLDAEALLDDTDWTFDDELEILREEITHIADQLRADETKKMLTLIEVLDLHTFPKTWDLPCSCFPACS